jgi:anti-sigma factor RsiW
VTCDPEGVTSLVDGELAVGAEGVLARHLATCKACAAQAAFERRLQEALRRAPRPVPAALLGPRIRSALRGPGARDGPPRVSLAS